MECIVKVLEGPDRGQEVRAPKGDILIGRSSRAQLRLNSAGVSVEHAVITRDGDAFYFENLSANGSQINDNKVTGKTRLRFRDRIRVAEDTLLRFDSPESGGFLGRSGLLVGGVILLAIVVVVVFIVNPLGPRATDSYNLPQAYSKLEAWVNGEVVAGQLPPETARLLQEGWRLEEAQDYRSAQGKYWQLQLLLESGEPKIQWVNKANREHPRSLRQLLTEKASDNEDPEELAAALKQFAQWRQKECVRKTPSTGL